MDVGYSTTTAAAAAAATADAAAAAAGRGGVAAAESAMPFAGAAPDMLRHYQHVFRVQAQEPAAANVVLLFLPLSFLAYQ